MDLHAWHGKTLAQHISMRDTYVPLGYRFISLSVYGTMAEPCYAAVMARPAVLARPIVPVTQHDYPAVKGDHFQSVFDAEAALGYGPIIIAATGLAANPLFAVVFEKQPTIPFTRVGLGVNGDAGDKNNTIQAVNAQARQQGLILRWVASYGDASAPAFAAVWVPNPAHTMWANDGTLENHDGVLDDAAGYQARFEAQKSVGNRLAFVTLNRSGQYLGVYTDAQLADKWYPRYDLTPAQYQTAFDAAKAEGYHPICVQAAGHDANAAKFAAIFAITSAPAPRSFTATGPVANAAIDDAIQQQMALFNVRQAALAIVHGPKLVYARGYTWAESGYPHALPTTYFRLASVSKVPPALAIYQLIEADQSLLGRKVNDILGLHSPAGHPPYNEFKSITVGHLLSHTSPLDPGAAENGVAVRDAWINAGYPATLPVTAEQTDAYIASLSSLWSPVSKQYYNNCGYYLLARIVAKLRGKSRAIDALQQYLFSPLGITRIRRGVSLVTAQPPDEARYQAGHEDWANTWYDLRLEHSQMTPARPLVPEAYGARHLEIMEGSGGLSGAAPDVARLAAMLLWPQDNPAMKRATLESLLTAGAEQLAYVLADRANRTLYDDPRAGYGFDNLENLGPGRFRGHKGGLLGGTSTVLNFGVGSDQQWGFVLLWAGSTPGSKFRPPGPDWYGGTSFLSFAETQLGNADLFPSFGMPSF